MAKKGNVHQLQTEINTDDELNAFLQKPGLIVMDVYTEWCGPCIAMISNLKKIKLELGGDDLQLAVVKTDHIEALKRFHNKSEPTWLFASSGKLVNSAFGSNVPHLMKLITDELMLEKKYRAGEAERTFFGITELSPIEQARWDKKMEQMEANAKIEKEAVEQKRRDYILFVTREIMEHANDLAVTIFMPHVISRDLFKIVSNIGEKCLLTAKEKLTITITEADLELIHFECENPIEKHILEHISGQNLFAVCWKLSDTELRPAEEVIQTMVQLLIEPQPAPNQVLEEDEEEVKLPPLLQGLQIEVKKPKIEEAEETSDGQQDEEDKTTANEIDDPVKESDNHSTDDINQPEEVSTEMDNENNEASEPNNEEDDNTTKPNNVKTLPEEETITLVIPPLWTPVNRTANACLIYQYFRPLTDHFLPPDPIPEPPHCVIIFDAFKRRDILQVCDKYREEILAYGYFTSDDPDSSKMVAASTFEYSNKKPELGDKLVLKVSQLNQSALLELASQSPCYVSQNAVEGEAECLKFFPKGFKQGSENPEEEEDAGDAVKAVKSTKKKKKKKAKEEGKDDDLDSHLNGTESGDDDGKTSSQEMLDTLEPETQVENEADEAETEAVQD